MKTLTEHIFERLKVSKNNISDKEIDNMPIAYNEDGEVFYIVDINNYEKMQKVQ